MISPILLVFAFVIMCIAAWPPASSRVNLVALSLAFYLASLVFH